MRKLIVGFLFWMTSLFCWAQTQWSTPSECPDFVLIYGNGVMTTQERAIVSWLKAADRYAKENQGYHVDTYFAFASSGSNPEKVSPINDLIETFGQKILLDRLRLSWSKFFRWYNGDSTVDAVLKLEDREQLRSLHTQTGIDLLIRIRNSIKDATSEAASDLRVHVDQLYKPALLEGKRFVVIAHSQGNYFANEAYELLSKDPSIGSAPKFRLASVATPALFVASDNTNTRYVTAAMDLVVFAVDLLAGALDPNVPFNETEVKAGASADWTGHGFLETYLNPELPTLAKLDQVVDAAYSDMPLNCYSVPIDAAGTYLATRSFTRVATSVSLLAINANSGSKLELTRVGDYIYAPSGIKTDGLNGVFQGGGGFLSPGAGSTLPSSPSLNSCEPSSSQPPLITDISQDFGIFGSPGAVVVPVGADSIAFSTPDCYFPDNVSTGFGVKLVVMPPVNIQ